MAEELTKQISSKLDETVLIQIAKKYGLVEEIKIKNVRIEPDFGKLGDSYLSSIFKFTFDAEGKNSAGQSEKVFIPVFAKATPHNLGRRATYRSSDFFETETVFYETVWPAILAYCDTKNLKSEYEKIVPKVLASYWDSKNDFIVLEDLSYQKFKTMERTEGFNFESAVKVIKLFAKFHGASLAYKHEKEDEFKKIAKQLKETYFARRLKPWYNNFQELLIRVVQDAIKNELPVEYYNKLDAIFKDDFYNKICDTLSIDDGIFGAVTQGDNWIPNFLFQFNDDGTITENIVIIDFQLARYSSAIGDLIFFLLCCVEMKCLSERWDDLFSVYHQELCIVLRKFGIEKELFSLEDIKFEVRRISTFALGMSIEATCMGMLNEDEAFDLNVIQGDQAVPIEKVWTLQPFKDDIRKKRIAACMKLIVDKLL